jgi:protein phosphatase 1 regulatory subunit 11
VSISLRMAHGGSNAQQTSAVATQILQEAPTTVQAAPTQQETVRLILRPRKKVSWDVDTIDNEHMQKKSSKICCVFHKEELDDSSDEEDSGGHKRKGKGHCHHPSDEDNGCGGEGKGKRHDHNDSSEGTECSGKT